MCKDNEHYFDTVTVSETTTNKVSDHGALTSTTTKREIELMCRNCGSRKKPTGAMRAEPLRTRRAAARG
jgi:hypothetical protein